MGFFGEMVSVLFSISVQACSILDLHCEGFIALIAPNLIFPPFTCTPSAPAEIARISLGNTLEYLTNNCNPLLSRYYPWCF